MSEQEFRLPDLGEGLADAELVSWAVSVGDEVALNQMLAEVETAKAVVELPSPFAGRVSALLAEPGNTVQVGAPLIRIDTADHAPAQPPTAPADSGPAAPAREPVLVGYGPAEPSSSQRTRPPVAPPAGRTPTADDNPAAGRVAAKPMARKLARELGVDLTALAGPQPVTPAQVRAAADARGGLEPEQGADPHEWREPATAVRKRIAAAMTESATTIPQVCVFITTDVSGSLRLTEKLRSTPQFDGLKLTPLALVAKAALLALHEHPLLNARWDAEASEIVMRNQVNLGLAVATERGLLVPVVKAADTLTLPTLCAALDSSATAARAAAADPAGLTGATFTISNFGVFGVDAGAPMVPPGTTAILGLGAIRKQPMVIADELVARPACTLSLAFDHRLIDGDIASAFLTDLVALVADPALAVQY